jgi:hypothetical protein
LEYEYNRKNCDPHEKTYRLLFFFTWHMTTHTHPRSIYEANGDPTADAVCKTAINEKIHLAFLGRKISLIRCSGVVHALLLLLLLLL